MNIREAGRTPLLRTTNGSSAPRLLFDQKLIWVLFARNDPIALTSKGYLQSCMSLP